MYPVTSASDELVIGAPLFKKIKVKLENGKEIIINARKNSNQNRYIEAMKFNGKNYSKSYLRYSELIKGAKIDIEMSSTINKSRGINDEDLPYSLSKEEN